MLKVYNDIPEKGQMYLQEEATPLNIGIIEFHDIAMYYGIIIIIFVTYFVFKLGIIKSLNSLGYIGGGRLEYIRWRNASSIIEIIWMIIPGIILILLAIPSLKLLYALDDIIKPNVTLKAIGHQWYWSYEINDIEDLSINFDSYTFDPSSFDSFHYRLLDVDSPVFLPILTPIRLLISSTDVIHSFFVPSLGIKIDAIPGRINHASLFILRPGIFYGQCAELCGNAHHQMSIVIKGVENIEYLSWLSSFSSI